MQVEVYFWQEISPQNLPPFGRLINVRYENGGVKLTTFKGIEQSENGVLYKFHSGDFVYTEQACRSHEGQPTHFLILMPIEGFEIKLQPE